MPTINLVTEIPGPKSKAMVARREAATARGASKLTQIAVEKAEGAAVLDVDGNTLLDFAGGIGVLAVGHCPPAKSSKVLPSTSKTAAPSALSRATRRAQARFHNGAPSAGRASSVHAWRGSCQRARRSRRPRFANTAWCRRARCFRPPRRRRRPCRSGR